MTFSEVREYQFGDDIRSIDWNVTARFNHPYVKIFDEERELTVILIIDVSRSNEFGTQKQLKQELITELSAVLAFSAIHNNDKVGVIFYSAQIEKYIPPKKGASHILRIIRELIDFKPKYNGTDTAGALRFFTNVIKKKCTAFLISDFLDKGFDDALKITNKKHDLIALKINDARERELPDVGLIRVKDAESGITKWVDTSNSSLRKIYKENKIRTDAELNNLFVKCGIDVADLDTDKDYVKTLMKLFKKRESR